VSRPRLELVEQLKGYRLLHERNAQSVGVGVGGDIGVGFRAHSARNSRKPVARF
jgi:hypothetical protein